MHSGFPDPAAVAGSLEVQRVAFAAVFERIDAWVRAFCQLPLESFTDRAALAAAVRDWRPPA
jgi:hypothetical protein